MQHELTASVTLAARPALRGPNETKPFGVIIGQQTILFSDDDCREQVMRATDGKPFKAGEHTYRVRVITGGTRLLLETLDTRYRSNEQFWTSVPFAFLRGSLTD